MDILKQMVHTNMTPLYEIIDDPNSDKVFIIMQYLNAGNFEAKLEESMKQSNGCTGLPEEEIRCAFRQLVSALHYCHEVKNVAHRGVKPSNMMLESAEGAKLKVCDFGLSQFFQARPERLESGKMIKLKH